MSRPTWARGLKRRYASCASATYHVASYVGAWIETSILPHSFAVWTSRPTWARGLKLTFRIYFLCYIFVASYVGAWIETEVQNKRENEYIVASYVGAWIETSQSERETCQFSRVLRGRVD